MSERQNPDGLNLALSELSLQACELKELLFDLACSTHALITTLRETLPQFGQVFDANRQAVREQLQEEAKTIAATKTSLELMRQKYSCRFQSGPPVADQQPVTTKIFRSRVFPQQP